MGDKIRLTKAYWHEACDRTACVIDIVDTMLVAHPAIGQTKDIKEKIDKVQELLGEIYQAAGSKM